jgi:hypothetical protein
MGHRSAIRIRRGESGGGAGKKQGPFDFAQGRLSTTPRGRGSGRDDGICGCGRERGGANKKQIPRLRLGMTISAPQDDNLCFGYPQRWTNAAMPPLADAPL